MNGDCFDCGRKYGDEYGFPDMILPNEPWRVISPDGEGNGVLCPSCICKRLHDAGLEKVPVYFASGPCCMPSTAEADHALESMVKTREEADRYWETLLSLQAKLDTVRADRDNLEGLVHVNEWLNLKIMERDAELTRLRGVVEEGVGIVEGAISEAETRAYDATPGHPEDTIGEPYCVFCGPKHHEEGCIVSRLAAWITKAKGE